MKRICTYVYVYVYVYAYVGKNVGFNPSSIGAGFKPTSTGVGTNMGFNPMSIGVGINPTSSDDMNDETTLYEYCHIRPGPGGNEPNPDPNPTSMLTSPHMRWAASFYFFHRQAHADFISRQNCMHCSSEK